MRCVRGEYGRERISGISREARQKEPARGKKQVPHTKTVRNDSSGNNKLSSLFVRLLGHLRSPFFRPSLHFFWAYVFDVCAQAPHMPEGIDHLSITIAPEHVGYRHLRCGACIGRPFERLVCVFYVKIYGTAGTAQGLRRLVTHLREFIVEKDDGIPNLQLRVTNLTVRHRHAHNLLRSQRLLVELDGCSAIPDRKTGCDGVKALRNRSCSFCHVISPSWDYGPEGKVKLFRRTYITRLILWDKRTRRDEKL